MSRPAHFSRPFGAAVVLLVGIAATGQANAQPPRGSGRMAAPGDEGAARDAPDADATRGLTDFTLEDVHALARLDTLVLTNGQRVRGHITGDGPDGYEVFVPAKRGEFLRTVVRRERVARVEYADEVARAAMRRKLEWWRNKTPDFEKWTGYTSKFLPDWYGLRGWHVQGRFFTLETDFPEDAALEFTRHLDLVYPEYCRVWQVEPTTPKFIRARVFRTKQDYVRALRHEHVKAERVHNSGGAFLPRTRMVFARDRPTKDRRNRLYGLHASAWEILYHECHHAFVFREILNNGRKPYFPIWVEEGLAEYFRVSRLEGETLHTGLPDPAAVARVLQARQKGRYIPLARLLAINDYDGMDGPVAYAEFGTLVRYLETKGIVRKRGGWAQFAGAYKREAVTRFAEVLGVSVGALEREWLQYLQAQAP